MAFATVSSEERAAEENPLESWSRFTDSRKSLKPSLYLSERTKFLAMPPRTSPLRRGELIFSASVREASRYLSASLSLLIE